MITKYHGMRIYSPDEEHPVKVIEEAVAGILVIITGIVLIVCFWFI